MFKFEILKEDAATGARTGRMHTAHGTVLTPCFMPVATQAAVKGATPRELEEIGYELLIVNSYHVYLRPGVDTVKGLGGLHGFMAWPHPVVTDSGGFQVLSLAGARKITPEGITFRSHLDGSAHSLTPEKAVGIQEALGSDISMCLDECPPFPSTYEYMEGSVALTSEWARRCRETKRPDAGALFGIVQGGIYPDLRERSARELVDLDFEGYSIGGLGIGESAEARVAASAAVVGLLPRDKPRYLMGVGTPPDIVEAVALGVDMFDCVLPTRNARNGTLFTNHGKMVIKNARYANDSRPIDEGCNCYTCGAFSRAYLRHLYVAGEILASTLLTLHNLTFYAGLMERIRAAITRGELEVLKSILTSHIGDSA